MNFDAFGHMGKAWEIWQKLANDSVARLAGMAKDVESVEAQGVQRANDAIDEAAKLTKETLAYGARLASEWRKLSLAAFGDLAKAGEAAR